MLAVANCKSYFFKYIIICSNTAYLNCAVCIIADIEFAVGFFVRFCNCNIFYNRWIKINNKGAAFNFVFVSGFICSNYLKESANKFFFWNCNVIFICKTSLCIGFLDAAYLTGNICLTNHKLQRSNTAFVLVIIIGCSKSLIFCFVYINISA